MTLTIGASVVNTGAGRHGRDFAVNGRIFKTICNKKRIANADHEESRGWTTTTNLGVSGHETSER